MDASNENSSSSSKLRQWLSHYFSESEIEDIAFDLDVDYEELTGSNKSGKARALIDYLRRRGRLPELIALVANLRSHVAWEELEIETADDSKTNHSSPEPFVRYEAGLAKLLAQLEPSHPRYGEALVYQQRLIENIAQTRRYGDDDGRRADRMEIIDHLNQLSLDEVALSFNELSLK